MHFASIDIGSNTTLLLIGTFSPEGKIIPHLERAEITRLSEKISETGNLQEEAMERTLRVLQDYVELCHSHKVERIACVGTEALRQAHNSNEFTRRAKERFGINIEIIPGSKEAELAYYSAYLDFYGKYPPLVVLDIGGGSTELIWQIEEKENTERLQTISMRLGSVRLTEDFLKHDPVLESEFRNMEEAIEEKLRVSLDSLVLPEGPIQLVGLAGTVTSLASIDQQLAYYVSHKIQGALLEQKSLEEIILSMKSKSIAERKKMLGMEPKRADVLLAGACILKAVMQKLGTLDLIVSDHGIRYGLFYQRFLSSLTTTTNL